MEIGKDADCQCDTSNGDCLHSDYDGNASPPPAMEESSSNLGEDEDYDSLPSLQLPFKLFDNDSPHDITIDHDESNTPSGINKNVIDFKFDLKKIKVFP